MKYDSRSLSPTAAADLADWKGVSGIRCLACWRDMLEGDAGLLTSGAHDDTRLDNHADVRAYSKKEHCSPIGFALRRQTIFNVSTRQQTIGSRKYWRFHQ